MRSRNSGMRTSTGQPATQGRFLQAMQRCASRTASSGVRPRLTSVKLWLRCSAFCSGMATRSICMRSLADRAGVAGAAGRGLGGRLASARAGGESGAGAAAAGRRPGRRLAAEAEPATAAGGAATPSSWATRRQPCSSSS